MTLGSTPQPADVVNELRASFPYTFPDAASRWLADVGTSAAITFPTSFAGKAAVKVVGTASNAGGTTSTTFSGVSFGAAYTGRVLIACICLAGGVSAALDQTAVTIGGVSASGNDNGEALAAGPVIGAGIWGASVPSGTSGSVTVTWTGTSATAAGLILLSVAGISPARFDFASPVPDGNGGTGQSGTLNIPSNGVLVVASAHSNSSGTTFGGVTGQSGMAVGAFRFDVGFNNRLSTQTGRAVSASWSGTAARALQAQSYT